MFMNSDYKQMNCIYQDIRNVNRKYIAFEHNSCHTLIDFPVHYTCNGHNICNCKHAKNLQCNNLVLYSNVQTTSIK